MFFSGFGYVSGPKLYVDGELVHPRSELLVEMRLGRLPWSLRVTRALTIWSEAIGGSIWRRHGDRLDVVLIIGGLG